MLYGGLNVDKMKEEGKLTGTAFLIVGPPKDGKTRTLGSLPGKTLFVSFDSGSGSALKQKAMLGIKDSEMYVKNILKSLKANGRSYDQLDQLDLIIAALESKDAIETWDNVVFEPLTLIDALIQKKINDESSRFEGTQDGEKPSHGQAFYLVVQTRLLKLLNDMMALRPYYNIIVTSHSKNIKEPTEGGTYDVVSIYGKASVKIINGIFDEIYTLKLSEELDTAKKINTRFNIKKKNIDMENPREPGYFAGTRNIEDPKILKEGSIVADFREIYKHTGYIIKKDR